MMHPSPRIKYRIEKAMAIAIVIAALAAHGFVVTSDNAHRCLNGKQTGTECAEK